MLLLPVLEKTNASRIVTVSSMAHKIPFKKLDLENISNPAKYSKAIHYTKSKVNI